MMIALSQMYFWIDVLSSSSSEDKAIANRLETGMEERTRICFTR